MNKIADSNESSPVPTEHSQYPEYKDSGAEWLGDIPSAWDCVRLGNIFKVVNGATPKTGVDEYWNGSVSWATPDDLSSNGEAYLKETNRTLSEEGLRNCGAQKVPENSLILSTRAPIGLISVAGRRMSTNQGCKAVVPTCDLYEKYFYYLISIATPELKSWGSGSTFTELSNKYLKALRLAFPSKSEQKAIVDFLDQETEKIDRLIEQKERLIELLEEKREALITRAVTKGLDPDTEMKDSGVEWLGSIPKHWDHVKLKYVADIESGHTPTKSNDEYWEDGEIPWVSLNDIPRLRKKTYIRQSESTISESGLKNSAAVVLPQNTVLLSRDASIGETAIIQKKMTTSQHFLNWICKSNLTPEYLQKVFEGPMQSKFDEITNGATISTIGMPHAKKFAIPLPPVSEQKEIISYLDNQLNKIDVLIDKISTAITTLKDYRKALISHAVTGKIDVREEVDAD